MCGSGKIAFGNGKVAAVALADSQRPQNHCGHSCGMEVLAFKLTRFKALAHGNVGIKAFLVVVSAVAVADSAVIGEDYEEGVVFSSAFLYCLIYAPAVLLGRHNCRKMLLRAISSVMPRFVHIVEGNEGEKGTVG